jgi:hypothetical protein
MCIAIYSKHVPKIAALLALVCLKYTANQCLGPYTTENFQHSIPEETACTEQNTLISPLNFTTVFNVNSVTPSYIPIIKPISLKMSFIKALLLPSYITVIKKHNDN